MNRSTNSPRTRWLFATSIALAALLAASITSADAQRTTGSGHSLQVVATGLNNPRGITIAPNGSIYVAEAGLGGSELIVSEDGSGVCVGNTGSVVKIRGDNVVDVATFPSLADAVDDDGPGPGAPACDVPGSGIAATGPADVAIEADGDLLVTVGLGGDAAFRAQLPEQYRAQLGTLQQVKPDGTVNTEADLTAFEESRDPDGAGADSNPFGVASTHYGRRVVVDSGGNDVLEIDAWGGVRRYVSSFPRLAPAPFTPPSCFGDLPEEAQMAFPPAGAPIPPQAVPTSIVVGPDGAYYVALLSGFPFVPGTAAVYRVDPASGHFTTFASGLSHVMGLDFGPDGSLYVAELVTSSLLEAEICDGGVGAIVQIRNGEKTVITDEILLPGGLVVDHYGAIYVTSGAILPGQGEVVKIPLAD